MGDYDNIINTAVEEAHAVGKAEGIVVGKAEGIAIGKAEGSRQANQQSAKNLKALGVAVDVIAQATGLSVEEVEGL